MHDSTRGSSRTFEEFTLASDKQLFANRLHTLLRQLNKRLAVCGNLTDSTDKQRLFLFLLLLLLAAKHTVSAVAM